MIKSPREESRSSVVANERGDVEGSRWKYRVISKGVERWIRGRRIPSRREG